MKVLLDTHALLRWLADDDRLGRQAREMIADQDHEVLVSAASLREIVVEVRVGTLEADSEDVLRSIGRQGFTLLAIGPSHLAALGGLPRYPDHRDPFDHPLIAQAITEAATFVSEDRDTPRYPVPFITCSDP